MAGLRAQWKGYLKFGEVACGVALYTAASTSERITFHVLNKATGNRVQREFVDTVTGDLVPRDAQVKGYEIENQQYIILDPEEIAQAVPESDKTLNVQAFLDYDQIDDVYFDKPYYLTPSDRIAEETFVVLREGLRNEHAAAVATAVLFRKMRTLLIRPLGDGLIATTLNFDYEVRSADKAFEAVPTLKIEGEMLDLAKHIIDTKMGTFSPADFTDRYEAAVADLVKAKIEGRELPKKKPAKVSQPGELLAALRQSAKMLGKPNLGTDAVDRQVSGSRKLPAGSARRRA
jgi:DNA end-binding protein Ku